jgi:adenylosuccinate synthase
MGKLTIVYGGQFGSEGKGQIVAYIAGRHSPDVAVRVGGPNAGHTFLLPNGTKQVVQTIPAPVFISKDTYAVIGAAGLIIPKVFARELWEASQVMGFVPSIIIDECAGVITKEHMMNEAGLKKSIGSTGEGVGAATAEKVMRVPSLTLQDKKTRQDFIDTVSEKLSPVTIWIRQDTPSYLNQALRDGMDVIIEGTQGVGLSLHTSGFYPFCTSRECTPQGMLAQTGIAEENARTVEKLMVIRTFPIRVGGNSGDLTNEITWKKLRELTGGYVKEAEITTVTKKKRRIAEFDGDFVMRNVIATRPTGLALTFFDYWYPEIATATDPSALTSEHWSRINHIERQLGVPVKYLSTGFGTVIPLRVTL